MFQITKYADQIRSNAFYFKEVLFKQFLLHTHTHRINVTENFYTWMNECKCYHDSKNLMNKIEKYHTSILANLLFTNTERDENVLAFKFYKSVLLVTTNTGTVMHFVEIILTCPQKCNKTLQLLLVYKTEINK